MILQYLQQFLAKQSIYLNFLPKDWTSHLDLALQIYYTFPLFLVYSFLRIPSQYLICLLSLLFHLYVFWSGYQLKPSIILLLVIIEYLTLAIEKLVSSWVPTICSPPCYVHLLENVIVICHEFLPWTLTHLTYILFYYNQSLF